MEPLGRIELPGTPEPPGRTEPEAPGRPEPEGTPGPEGALRPAEPEGALGTEAAPDGRPDRDAPPGPKLLGPPPVGRPEMPPLGSEPPGTEMPALTETLAETMRSVAGAEKPGRVPDGSAGPPALGDNPPPGEAELGDGMAPGTLDDVGRTTTIAVTGGPATPPAESVGVTRAVVVKGTLPNTEVIVGRAEVGTNTMTPE